MVSKMKKILFILLVFIPVISFGQALRVYNIDTIANSNGQGFRVGAHYYYQTFSVNAGSDQSPCLCDTILLSGTSTGADALKWYATYPDGSAASGTYSDRYNDTTYYYPGTGDCDSTYLDFMLVGYDTEQALSWLTFSQESITDSIISDTSGNGNDWKLRNSNALKLNGVAFIDINDTLYIPLNKEYFVDFYASLNQPTWGMVLGGLTSTNYISLQNTGVTLRTPNLLYTFTEVQVPSDDLIRHYRINIDTDSIEVINLSDNISQTVSNPFGVDSIGVARLGNRRSSGTLNGYLFGVNLNNEHIWPLAEGYAQYCFEVVTGTQNTIDSQIDSLWVYQNEYHYNLTNGFSIYYNSPTKQVFVPFDTQGNHIDAVIEYYTYTGEFAGGNYHNSAETGVEPPLILLPYDYNNYLFDVSNNPNILYYENFSENVGNRIFMNVSTSYQYKDLKVYNKEVE